MVGAQGLDVRAVPMMLLFLLLAVMVVTVSPLLLFLHVEVTSSFCLIGHLQSSSGCWHCLWHLILHMCNATAFPASTKSSMSDVRLCFVTAAAT